VEERLAGVVVAPSGASVPDPAVSWKGRRHGPRQSARSNLYFRRSGSRRHVRRGRVRLERLRIAALFEEDERVGAEFRRAVDSSASTARLHSMQPSSARTGARFARAASSVFSRIPGLAVMMDMTRITSFAGFPVQLKPVVRDFASIGFSSRSTPVVSRKQLIPKYMPVTSMRSTNCWSFRCLRTSASAASARPGGLLV
jgi:hypothetical protein